MATKLFIRTPPERPGWFRGNKYASPENTIAIWGQGGLSTTAGAAIETCTLTTGGSGQGTSGLTFSWGTYSFNECEWISPPLAADVTISGTITMNFWMKENAMTDNGIAAVIIERWVGADEDGGATQILNNNKAAELPTTIAAQNWTGTPTSTAFKRGDRIRILVTVRNNGTIPSAAIFSFTCNANTAGATGDSYVSFTEALTFETTDPATGTQIFLTDTASDINPGAAVEKRAWTAREGSVVTSVVATTTGWLETNPGPGTQITNTSGGTAIEWYTPTVQAFTLGGMATAKLRYSSPGATPATSFGLRIELAVVNGDGSGEQIWAKSMGIVGNDNRYPVANVETTLTSQLCGQNISVTTGQRLRIRLYLDDGWALAQVAGTDFTTYYAGASGATGDAYVILQQSISEDVVVYVPRNPAINHSNPALL